MADLQVQGLQPDRKLAVARAKESLLYEWSRDSAGVHIRGTKRLFALTAPPRQIGQESVGLGVYLTSNLLFCALAFALSLLSIYPLADNVHQEGYKPQYTLNVDSNLTSCTKNWDATNNVLETTFGSSCADPKYTSPYSCSAQCLYKQSTLQEERCLAAATATATPGGACEIHPPCNEAVEDVTRPDGYCFCCDMVLDRRPGTYREAPAGQIWSLFVCQMLCLLFFVLLHRIQGTAAEQINASVISAGDYSVLLKGVGPTTTHQQVQEWCTHYGEVVLAVVIPGIGEALAVGTALESLLMRQNELFQPDVPIPLLLRPAVYPYRMLLGNLQKLQAQVHAAQEQLGNMQRAPPTSTGDLALATYNYEQHANNCIRDNKHRGWQNLLTSLHLSSRYLSPPLNGHYVKASRAPEPSDWWYENSAVARQELLRRRLLSGLLTVAIVAAGALVQYGLAAAAESQRNSRLDFERSSVAADASLASKALNAARLRLLSIISGIFVVMMNMAIAMVVHRLSLYERWPTYTQFHKYLVVKLSLFYLINSYVMPLLATSLSASAESWFSKGGFIEQGFYIQVVNAVLPSILTIVNPVLLLYTQCFSRLAKTQAWQDAMVAPPEFMLAERYAGVIKTLGLALFFQPVLPLSPFIACAGLAIGYWVDKYSALRQCRKPHAMDESVTWAVNLLLRLLPLVQLVLMRFVYFATAPAVRPMFWAGLAAWGTFTFAPFLPMFNLMRNRDLQDAGTDGQAFMDTLGRAADSAGGNGNVEEKSMGDSSASTRYYLPKVPAVCQPEFRREVEQLFSIPARVRPANDNLMTNQKASTGGIFTRPPPKRQAAVINMQAGAQRPPV